LPGNGVEYRKYYKSQAIGEYMSISKIINTTYGLFCVGLLFCLILGTSAVAEPNAPDFTLIDLHGKKVSLDNYRGKIVLLDFWATWCMPCRIATPELVKIQRNYRSKGLVILAISLDDKKTCDNQCLLDYKRKQKLNFKVLRGDIKILVDYFGTPNIAIPTSVIVNKKGQIVSMHKGYIPGLIERELKKLL
jgi:thiol-disulfide isomerase/thioredoxin